MSAIINNNNKRPFAEDGAAARGNGAGGQGNDDETALVLANGEVHGNEAARARFLANERPYNLVASTFKIKRLLQNITSDDGNTAMDSM